MFDHLHEEIMEGFGTCAYLLFLECGCLQTLIEEVEPPQEPSPPDRLVIVGQSCATHGGAEGLVMCETVFVTYMGPDHLRHMYDYHMSQQRMHQAMGMPSYFRSMYEKQRLKQMVDATESEIIEEVAKPDEQSSES